MDLGGVWQAAASTDERRRAITGPAPSATATGGAGRTGAGTGAEDRQGGGWCDVVVPGHWRSQQSLADSDGPVLYRREFSAPAPAENERVFLTFDGIFYQGDVWLDGEYLGDTEGYFVAHSFEIGEQLRERSDHLLTVEVSCSRPPDLKAKRNLTGVFQHWDCIDPDWNPGGIWSPVRLERCGPVRIHSLKVLCREASPERARLDLEAVLVPIRPGPVTVTTTVTPETGSVPSAVHDQEKTLAVGANTVRWRVAIQRPQLWWPRALGGQPLYRVDVAVAVDDGGRGAGAGAAESWSGRPSDRRHTLTGLRQIRMRDFVATVNGERLFLKGANLGPTRRDPAAASPQEVRADVGLAAQAGLDLLRVHAHIARPELYDEADRTGMLLWQDLPLQWGYGRVRRQAVAQARAAVTLLGHHPSVALWCGHNEPMALQLPPGGAPTKRDVAKVVASQVLPTWNKTGLDRSIRRALERADGSRPVVTHSGVVPHPLWGTDSHFYFGWYHGEERDLPAAIARWPVLGRFVSEFGAQAVPETAGFMFPGDWPALDWDHLMTHHCLQRDIFEARIPPGRFASFDSWRRATQLYQAELLRHHIETIRRLKYRPAGGFCFFLLADAQPAVTWSVLDHARVAKLGYEAVKRACAPVIVVASRLPARVLAGQRLVQEIHVVSDLRSSLDETALDAVLRWPGGTRSWRFAGAVGADRCVRVGQLSQVIPADSPSGALVLELHLRWAGGEAVNRYESRVEGHADPSAGI